MIIRAFGIRAGRVLFLAGSPPLKTDLDQLLPELPFDYQPYASYALLVFPCQMQALRALETLKDKEVAGRRLRVRLAAPCFRTGR